MQTPAPIDSSLEGPGSAERLRRIRQEFAEATGHARPRRFPAWVDNLVYGVLIAAVVVVASAAFSAWRWNLMLLVSGKTELTQPFAGCNGAHAAGYYNIPRSSPGYSPYQDGDGDGLACEPHRY